MKYFILLFILLSMQVAAEPDRITGIAGTSRSEVIATQGMVATSQPLATQIGIDILKQGGNALDAAIAANAALGLMEPTGNGIGGDLFAIIWDAKSKQLYGINGSGRSPLGLSFKQLKKELKAKDLSAIPPLGFLPISVPGTVDAWFTMHERFGRLSMKKILAPAISYANEGFPVSELIAYYWGLSVPSRSKQPGDFINTFTIDGKAPVKGQIFKNPDLANTLQLLADKGRNVFYKGEVADKIDRFMKKHGGYLRKKDFTQHRSQWVTPLSVNYRGYDVWELPPNGQGIAALQILNILEQYDLKSLGQNSTETLHLMVEAKKLVFEDRAKLYTDPDFAKLPIEHLLSKAYAVKRANLIGKKANQKLTAGTKILEKGDTIYLTTADSDGNMVSLIQSNYRGMGSGVVVPGLGFGFQDRGELFSMDPEHANVYQPGKRPFHTIIPAFITKDGKPFISFGLMGGAMQPQGHVQIVTNIIDFDMNLQEAGDAARWQHGGSTEPTESATSSLTNGGYLQLESALPYQTVRELMKRGHDIRYDLGGYGGYQAIMVDDNGVYFGASESRKDGQVAGY